MASDQMVGAVQGQKAMHLSFSTDQRAGDQLLQVRDLSKSYDGKQLWQRIAFEIRRGERVGIIGPNGSGKTTLLESLIGLRDADEGKIRWGTNLNIGYYDQDFGDLDEEKTVLEQVMSGRSDMGLQPIRDMLGTMLFSDWDVEKKIGILSGGEQARVRLAELLLDKPNVLVLDEPTNHLDIASREALEQTLQRFEGSILCVSHDRYFLKRICKRLMILRPPAMIDFPGNYEEWQWKQHQDQIAARQREAEARTAARKSEPAPAPRTPKPASSSNAKKNPYLRPFGRLTTQELEQQIHAAEQGILECEMAFAEPDTFKDAGKAKELQEEYDQFKHRLAQLEEEYFSREE
jgi:ATP-binding cassette subfamily F protein 3